MKKIFAIVLSVLIIFGNSVKCIAQEEPSEAELYAKSAVLMDASSGRILYEKNGFEAMANASTTKIMTCILALENCDPNGEVEVSARAAQAPKVHLGMWEGQKFYLRDLLYGLMLESYNDCAITIAEYISGSVEDFAAMMNDKAEEIGCTDTYFITPNGLDATDETGFHHTTAADLALIMRYCISLSPKAEQFLAITGTMQYSFCEITNGTSYSVNNHNSFLQMMDGAFSGKTGFTGNAGYCYVGALKRDGKTYIVALLACGWPNNKSYKWSDTKKLMQYGLDHFYQADVSQVEIDPKCLTALVVEDGQSASMEADAYAALELERNDDVKQILLENEESLNVTYDIAKKLKAPVEKGSYVGKVTISINEEKLCEYPIRTVNEVKKIDYVWCLLQVLNLALE